MNTITSNVHTPPRVAAAFAKPPAAQPQAKQAPAAEAKAKKVDLVAELQVGKEALALRMNQSLEKSQLNYSYDKKSSTLSVKVVNKQSGEFIRQIDFKGFHAMAFISHGYKGQVIDSSV